MVTIESSKVKAKMTMDKKRIVRFTVLNRQVLRQNLPAGAGLWGVPS
jgi:hypothetical protein